MSLRTHFTKVKTDSAQKDVKQIRPLIEVVTIKTMRRLLQVVATQTTK
jgi:hypothetical protein